MKLRLKLALVSAVCITAAHAFDKPLLVTADNPELDLTDERAEAILLSAHGDMFEVVDGPIAEEPVKVLRPSKSPKQPAVDARQTDGADGQPTETIGLGGTAGAGATTG